MVNIRNNSNFGCGPFIIGTIFVIIGVCLMIFLPCLTTMTCQRVNDSGVCVLTNGSLTNTNSRTIKIDNIVKAYVEEDWDDDGATYCMVIETKSGNVEFSPMYTSGSTEKYELANKMNKFLYDKEQKVVELVQDDRLFLYLFAGVFGGVGFIVAFVAFIQLLKKL